MVALGASEGQRGLEPVEPSAKAGGPVSCRTGCCCRGYAWIAPGMRNLQFCVYWPSGYWTERFLEDTTLTIMVPEVSLPVEELAWPTRFHSEYYNHNKDHPRLAHPMLHPGTLTIQSPARAGHP